jgi:hypothetical protein
MAIHITVSASSGMIHAPTSRHRPDHAYTCPSAVLVVTLGAGGTNPQRNPKVPLWVATS